MPISTVCEACDRLREFNEKFLLAERLTKEMCESLGNDTGLNPTLDPSHINCLDLNDINDCLLGYLKETLKSYDVCNTIDLMKHFLIEEIKFNEAMICSDCGQWRNIHALWEEVAKIWDEIAKINEKLDALCAISNQLVRQQAFPYDFPNHFHLVDDGTERPDRHAGIHYKRLDTFDCDGNQIIIEWIAPTITGYNVEDLSFEDVVATVDKATAQGWGITDNIWNQLTVYSAAFSSGYFFTDTGTLGRFMLDIEPDDPDTLKVVYLGSTAPNPQGFASHLEQDAPTLRVFVTG
ncbi:hypothetical protein FACS189418_6960 [Clostridia bacterium]|nr:hypothetical protein FACS189418_6960 [Clostridia bacterium]